MGSLLAVLVTFGTRTNTVYARGIGSDADAGRMKATASSFGYVDAEIVEENRINIVGGRAV